MGTLVRMLANALPRRPCELSRMPSTQPDLAATSSRASSRVGAAAGFVDHNGAAELAGVFDDFVGDFAEVGHGDEG